MSYCFVTGYDVLAALQNSSWKWFVTKYKRELREVIDVQMGAKPYTEI